VLAGCSHSSGGGAQVASRTTSPHPVVLVTIGSSATFGFGLDDRLRDAWPQKLYHEAFPRSTVLVNASDRDVTVSQARAQQLPLALEVHATVVAVWLGGDDLRQHHTAATFEAGLDAIVARLRAAGARVLVGNLSRSRAGAAAYDDAIARVARSRGATLVDVASMLSAASPGVGPGSAVDPAASASIARAFAVALARI
jgi:lysophospholipase L1-like esterase